MEDLVLIYNIQCLLRHLTYAMEVDIVGGKKLLRSVRSDLSSALNSDESMVLGVPGGFATENCTLLGEVFLKLIKIRDTT